jgi:hypothetical protein
MPRIAIVGSCITRDLWPIRGGGAEHLLYVSRTGFASLMSPPVPGFRPAWRPPGDLHKAEHEALVADLRKTALQRLLAWRPTHIIFDFIDERFDLFTVGGATATWSAELERSGYRTQKALSDIRRVPRLSDAGDRLWRRGAEAFAAALRATPLGQARLILHSARWATEQRLPGDERAPVVDVELIAGQPIEIAPYNALLERQEAQFLELMPPVAKVDAGALRLADPQHKWGLSPFHYVPEYYAEVRRQLMALGLDGAFTAPASGPRAAPSAPAA